MEQGKMDKAFEEAVLLHVNERLFQRGLLPRKVYEQAKMRIVERAASSADDWNRKK